MGMMDFMMGRMMKAMSKEDKEAMMDGMMDKMLADFTVEEKMEMMTTMMPKMMQDLPMLELMPKMMLDMMPLLFAEIRVYPERFGVKDFDFKIFMRGMMEKVMPVMVKGVGPEKMVEMKEEFMATMMESTELAQLMPEMKTKMMPGCMQDMLPRLPKDKRAEFAKHVIGILKEQGTADMNEQEREAFLKELFG